MSSNEDDEIRTITQALLESLLKDVESEKEREKREYLILNVVPSVVPAVTSLLRAMEAHEKKEARGEDVLPFNATNFLAKHLYRHNPRHTTPSKEHQVIKKISKELLSKNKY